MARLIDADALKHEIVGSIPMMATTRISIEHKIDAAPTIDAIQVEWLCERIRYEEKFGGIPFGEYIKVLIWDWHQQEQEAR